MAPTYLIRHSQGDCNYLTVCHYGFRQEQMTALQEKRQRKQAAYEAALADVRAGMSVREAAEVHDVKRTTLQDRVTGRYSLDTVGGRPKSVTEETEARIAAWVLSCSGDQKLDRLRLRSGIRTFLISNNERNYFKDNM